MFQPNRRFKKVYSKIFKEEPEAANLLLLLCELADEKGQVKIEDDELLDLFNARFNNPKEWAI